MTHTKKPIKNIQKTIKKPTRSPSQKRVVQHALKSLVSVAEHHHTGKALHHRHTSHGALLVALLLTGVLLFSNLGALRAYGLSSSGSQTISVTVNGHPPTMGADITYPTTNSVTQSPQIQVRGTCEAGTLVATYDNGNFVGSSVCTNDGTYVTTISLILGTNVLQSQNYDAANQPGPVTAQVTIVREQADTTPTTPIDNTPSVPNKVTPATATTPADITPNPSPTVTTPAPQPSENPCFDSSKTAALDPKQPTIIANCITRSVDMRQTITVPIRVTGGTSPYKLDINWGDGITDHKTVADELYHNYTHTYQVAGIVGVALHTTDSKGVTNYLQTVVQVNSTTATAPANSTIAFTGIVQGATKLWTQAPVPLFWAALAIVLGFWVGDTIERVLTRDKKPKRTRKPPIAPHRHRHA